jgi:hypothetical protein
VNIAGTFIASHRLRRARSAVLCCVPRGRLSPGTLREAMCYPLKVVPLLPKTA